MKILTEGRLEKAARLAGRAARILAEAERIVRGAHRSWYLRSRLLDGMSGAAGFIAAARDGVENGYLAPPRTRKAERMERLESKSKERRAKKEGRTMGGAGPAQGAGPGLPSGTVPEGGKTTQKVKE